MSMKSREPFYSHLQKPAAWWSHGRPLWEAAPSFLSRFWSRHDSSYRYDCKRQQQHRSEGVSGARAVLCGRLLPARFHRRRSSGFAGAAQGGSGVAAGAAAPTLLLGSFNPDQPPQPFPADSPAVPAGSERTRFSLRPGRHGSRGGTRPRAQHLTEEPGCSKRDRAGNSRSGWLPHAVPSWDLAGYQGDIIVRKLFSVAVT